MNAKIWLWGGMAVAVLAILGSKAAAPASAQDPPVLAFRAVVPSIAVDTADSGNANRVVATHLSARLDGGLVVTGEVLNQGATPIAGARVRVTYGSGETAVAAETQVLLRVVAPGGAGPFRVTLPGVTSLDRELTAEMVSFTTATVSPPSVDITISGPYRFQIGPPDPKTGVIPYSSVLELLRGSIHNASPSALTTPEVVIVAYDGAGNVAFVTTSSAVNVPFQEPGDLAVLAPGRTGTFVAGVPIGRLLEIPGEVTLGGYLNWSPGEPG